MGWIAGSICTNDPASTAFGITSAYQFITTISPETPKTAAASKYQLRYLFLEVMRR